MLKPYLKERNKHDFLASLYHGLHYSSINEDISIPSGVQVDLLSITVVDLVLVEEIPEIRNGIKRLLKLYPARFSFNNPNHVDETFDNYLNNIHGSRWSNLGNIQFEENIKIGKLLHSINIQSTQVSSSIIAIQYRLIPSDAYLMELSQIINQNEVEEIVFKPSIKKIFKYWGSSHYDATYVKRRKIEDYILELKWSFFSFLGSNHISSFFYKNKINSPSVLVYKIKQEYCSWENRNYEHQFWDSIGLPMRYVEHSISEDGFWQLYADSLSDSNIDDSIKITCNSLIELDSGYTDLDHQIIIQSDDLIKGLLSMLAIRRYTLFMSKQIAVFRVSIFKSIQNKKIKYKNILKQRLTIERNGHMLNRIKSEIQSGDYQNRAARMQLLSIKWEPADSKLYRGNWVKNIVANAEHLVNETYRHSESLVKMIDTTLEILTIQTNFSLQRRTIILTIVTIFLAIVTIYMTYYQITQESLIDLLDRMMNLLS